MENHPIPQDVTGFQFKLIGEMTVKQFAYLAAGGILAWATVSAPGSFFIKFPLASLFFATGFSLSFVPIAGRPMDLMLGRFIRAYFAPNQLIYQKVGKRLFVQASISKKHHKGHAVQKHSEEELKVFLQALPKKPKNKMDEKELSFLKSLSLSFVPKVKDGDKQPTKPHIITMEQEGGPPKDVLDKKSGEEKSEGELEKEAQILERELAQAQVDEDKQKTQEGGLFAHQKVLELTTQLQEVLSQKRALEEELFSLKRKLEASQRQVYTASQNQAPKEHSQNVHKIGKDAGRKTGAPIVADAPNLITGIIKDSRGNFLPNILVEVNDKDGNPVRAFKTNPLGQFASATPLLNGTYTIAFEDPKKNLTFDTIEITATGVMLEPLEVIARDQRDELKKALFGNA